MIITARNIPAYFDSMEFPFPVYPERSDEVIMLASKDGLSSLCAAGCVVGIGSWSKMRKIRLNNTREVVRTTFQTIRIPIAEGNRTIVVEDLGDIHRAFAHHRARSHAFSRGNGASRAVLAISAVP